MYEQIDCMKRTGILHFHAVRPPPQTFMAAVSNIINVED